MSLLEKIKEYVFTLSTVYVVIGLIMLINPKFVCDAINYIIGFAILIFGIIYLINLYNKYRNEINKISFLAGILCMSFGIFLILNTSLLISMIPFCSGVIITLDSIYQFKNSIELKKYGNDKWWINLLVAILFLSFAIYIMANAQNVTYLVIRIIGIILLLDAFMDIYSYLKLKSLKKDFEKSIVVVKEK